MFGTEHEVVKEMIGSPEAEPSNGRSTPPASALGRMTISAASPPISIILETRASIDVSLQQWPNTLRSKAEVP